MMVLNFFSGGQLVTIFSMHHHEFNNIAGIACIDEKMKVLFEQSEGEYIIGHTTNYLKVGVKNVKGLENNIKTVIVKEINNDILIGNLE